jgi:hypothetical protein
MTPGQLSLLKPPALELTERGRGLRPHVLGVYSTLLAHVRELHCHGRVVGVRRRRRCSKSPGWSDHDVRRHLGITRRQFPMLERCGLITWTDAGDLVVVRYHRSSECRDEEEETRRRRQARQAGIKSGESRRDRLKTRHGSNVGVVPDLHEIRDILFNLSAHLARTTVRTPLTADPEGGDIDLLSGGDSLGPSEGTQSGQTPSKNRPLWAPSVLKRVAPASPATVAHRVLRGRKVGPAPAPPSPARLSARTAPIPRDVRRGPRTRPETLKPGGARGPDFSTWYEQQFRRLGGYGIKREAAKAFWRALGQSPAERRRCWTFTAEQARTWRGGRKPPNTLAFLQVWQRQLERERVQRTRGEPTAVGADMDTLIGKLKRRGRP